MTDDIRPSEAEQQPAPGPSEPEIGAIPAESPESEDEFAAGAASVSDAEIAPPASGPTVEPPPVAGWDEPPATQPAAVPMHAAAGVSPKRASMGGIVGAAIAAAFVVGAFAGLAGGFLGARLVVQSNAGVRPSQIAVVPSKTEDPAVAAAAAAVPSVVNIDISSGLASGGQNGLPSSHPTVPVTGNGSGVAFKETSDGGTYILTNAHVVADAERITVRSPGGQSWPGTVVGSDADNDVAVVKISAKLPAIKLADSSKLLVGETVVAIGSPYGLEHTVTEGIISALGRSLPDYVESSGGGYPLVDVIQTDAAINPGNSGGALVDRQGRLVGLNTAIYSDTGAAAGIGFAIQVNTAVKVADQIIQNGKVTHPFIGLIGTTVTPELAKTKKLPVEEGALVQELAKGQGAEKAGVKVGDVVTAVDGKAIASMDDLILAIRRKAVGDTVTLTVLRSGQTLTFKVIIGDRPAGFSSTTPTTTPTPKK